MPLAFGLTWSMLTLLLNRPNELHRKTNADFLLKFCASGLMQIWCKIHFCLGCLCSWMRYFVFILVGNLLHCEDLTDINSDFSDISRLLIWRWLVVLQWKTVPHAFSAMWLHINWQLNCLGPGTILIKNNSVICVWRLWFLVSSHNPLIDLAISHSVRWYWFWQSWANLKSNHLWQIPIFFAKE